MDFSYVHIRYFIGYVYHICLQDTIQSTLSLCLRCQAMLLPMPLRPLLLTTRSGFTINEALQEAFDSAVVYEGSFILPGMEDNLSAETLYMNALNPSMISLAPWVC